MKIISTEIKELKPILTASIAHKGDYSAIAGLFQELTIWAGENNLWEASPKMAGVYFDDPKITSSENLRSRACIECYQQLDLPKNMTYYTITGGKYFVMQVELYMAEYSRAWQQAYTIFKQNEYEFDSRDNYELYLNCGGNSQESDVFWLVNLCLPIK